MNTNPKYIVRLIPEGNGRARIKTMPNPDWIPDHDLDDPFPHAPWPIPPSRPMKKATPVLAVPAQSTITRRLCSGRQLALPFAPCVADYADDLTINLGDC